MPGHRRNRRPPSLEATTTSEAPINPLPEPKTARYHAGQSLQIRVNADAGQNSDLINYRWSVNQVTVNATSDENGQTLVVPMPDRGKLIRYLNSFGHPTVENGVAQLDTPVENNVGLSRTVSLWPQDEDPKVSLKAEFWLDGVKQESAQDVVGKDGVLTAQYTVSNLSTCHVHRHCPGFGRQPGRGPAGRPAVVRGHRQDAAPPALLGAEHPWWYGWRRRSREQPDPVDHRSDDAAE